MTLYLLKIRGIKYDLKIFNYVISSVAFILKKKKTSSWNSLWPCLPLLPAYCLDTCTDLFLKYVFVSPLFI